MPARADLALSATTGEGIPDLWALLRERAGGCCCRAKMPLRSIDGSADCWLCAPTAFGRRAGRRDLIVFAEELRLAMKALDQLVGRSDVEAMLDALFTRFCLGK